MKSYLQKNILKTLLMGLLFVYSCSKDDPDAINDQEYISNVILTLESSGQDSQVIDWDISEMNSSSINLNANTEYNVNISFIDSSDPIEIENITLEVIEEAEEHQVFYEFAEVSVTVSSADNDTKVGARGVLINSVWSAGAAGSGVVRVYLVHQPTNFDATTREAMGGFNDVSIDIPINILE